MKRGFLVFIALYPQLLFSQLSKPLHFDRIEGLSQNTVYSLMKDKQGFLWIATANGLNRFDGVEMKAYKPSFEPAKGQMKGRIIRSALLEDDHDQVWFATDLSVNCFNKKRQQFTQQKLYYAFTEHEAGREQIPVTEMFANPVLKKDNYIWFASAAEGLFAVNTQTRRCISYPIGMKDEKGNRTHLMYNPAHDASGRLWFASTSGLLCFDPEKKTWNRNLANKPFYSISFLKDTIYLGNNDGITWFDIKTKNSGPSTISNRPGNIPQGMIRVFYNDGNMNVWAGDQTGSIFFKSRSKSAFTWLGNINGHSPSRTNYPIYCLYADTSGNLWAGADVLGLLKAKINSDVFTTYPAEISREKNDQQLFIHSVYEDENEDIWLGTFQNGLIRLNSQTGRTDSIRFPFYNPALPYARSVPLIKKDRYGNLWTSYSGYAYIREKNQSNFTPVRLPVPTSFLQSPQLWNLIEYDSGWLLATNVGLYLANKQHGKYHIRLSGAFAGTRIVTLWHAPDGQIWIVPESGGIYITQNPEDVRNAKRIFTDQNIKAIQYDSVHQIAWISATNGLIAYHLPSEKFELYTEKEGLLSSFVYSTLPGNQNEIWLSTNNSLSRGKMTFEGRSAFPQISFRNFTDAEGLPSSGFNTGAYHYGQSGNLYFGSANGVVWFKPDNVRAEHAPPSVRLTAFFVNDEALVDASAPEFLTKIKLSHQQNNLFFRFRGIDYNNADKVSYAYQLQGWDKDWVYSKKLNEVRYNNLPNGKYRFRVKAAGGSGIWGSEEYSVSITILPPFWKTWWFYTLSAMAALACLFFITRFFVQQKLRRKVAELEKLKEIDRERQRISREMHDDIGAGLTQIILMSESAKAKATTANEKELTEVADTSRKLVGNLSEIIWSLNSENKSLDHLCAYLREQLDKQLDYAGIEYTIRFPDDNKDVFLSNEQRRNILLVTKEIVNNAIKHSGAKNISVKMELCKNDLRIEVADNGKGFDTTVTYPGNGLKNMRNRIAESGGTMEIDSSPDNGSRFTYSIPVNTT